MPGDFSDTYAGRARPISMWTGGSGWRRAPRARLRGASVSVRRAGYLAERYLGDRPAGAPYLDGDEMATLPYLAVRLGEVYREAAATGGDIRGEYVLVVVETAPSPSRLVAETRLTALHSALCYAFVGGESIVAVSLHRLVVLAGQGEPRLADSLARLRSELKIALAEGRLPDVHSWRLALPRDVADLSLAVLGGPI
jgi:hypothetical protein